MIGKLQLSDGGWVMRSNATSGMVLMQDTIECIREEPLRYDQTIWIEKVDRSNPALQPPCGTAACRAGWMALLSGRSGRSNPGMEARRLIGDTWDTDPVWGANGRVDETHPRFKYHLAIGRLFSGDALYKELGTLGTIITNLNGTSPAACEMYAEAGIRGMEQFMNEHTEILVNARIDNKLARAWIGLGGFWHDERGRLVLDARTGLMRGEAEKLNLGEPPAPAVPIPDVTDGEADDDDFDEEPEDEESEDEDDSDSDDEDVDMDLEDEDEEDEPEE